MARNFLGGFNQPGKPLPLCVREEIIDLYNDGIRVSEISCNTEVSRSNKRSTLQKSCNTLPSMAQRSRFLVEAVSLTDDILEVVKLQKPSLYASERETTSRMYLYTGKCSDK